MSTGVGKEAVKGGLIADVNGDPLPSSPPLSSSQRYVEKIEDFCGQGSEAEDHRGR